MKFQAIKGVRDILPPDSELWNRIEGTARDVLSRFNFKEIRIPVLEQSDLFARAVGTETDIVSKEMFTFPDPSIVSSREFRAGWTKLKEVAIAFDPALGSIDPTEQQKIMDDTKSWVLAAYTSIKRAIENANDKSVSLRPEGTASVVRAYIQHGMQVKPGPVKLYYMGPMFRRERPQKGRYRQFYQIGAEVLGSSVNFAVDAELIAMLMDFLNRVGLKGHTLFINSIGCKHADCRPSFLAQLRLELFKLIDQLGPESRSRIETNPLRVLDSKLPDEQAVIEKLPRISEFLCHECNEDFRNLKSVLNSRRVSYSENPRLVRGLDYYTQTTFEVIAPGLGAQDAICGGGRYEGLVELIGGSKFSGIKGTGFAIGEDRLAECVRESGTFEAIRQAEVYIAWTDDTSECVQRIAARLQKEAIPVEISPEGMKLRNSLNLASRRGAQYALIIGGDEVASGFFTLKELATSGQQKLGEEALIEFLKARAKR